MQDEWSSQLLAEVDTKFRLTCLAAMPERQEPAQSIGNKKVAEDDRSKKSDEEEAEEDGDSEAELSEEEVMASDEVSSAAEDEDAEEAEESPSPEPKAKLGAFLVSFQCPL